MIENSEEKSAKTLRRKKIIRSWIKWKVVILYFWGIFCWHFSVYWCKLGRLCWGKWGKFVVKCFGWKFLMILLKSCSQCSSCYNRSSYPRYWIWYFPVYCSPAINMTLFIPVYPFYLQQTLKTSLQLVEFSEQAEFHAVKSYSTMNFYSINSDIFSTEQNARKFNWP